jgi:rRNA processing protein Krr1/Pno1
MRTRIRNENKNFALVVQRIIGKGEKCLEGKQIHHLITGDIVNDGKVMYFYM